MLSASIVVAAAGFESAGLALLGVAGGLWSSAAFLCSSAPLVAGHPASVNERVSTVLSAVAAASAAGGLILLIAPLMSWTA